YRDAEVRHILEDSGARLVLAPPDSEAAATARSIGIAVVGLDAPELADDAGAPWAGPPPSPDALGLIVYTSGTTGRSKGVALSQRALAANVGATTGLWRFSPDDTLVLALPLFHVHGLGLGVLGTLLRRMRTLILPRFDAAAVVAAFRDQGATVFMGVPTMYRQLLDALAAAPADAAALSHGRLFTSGSAALPAADLEAFERLTGQRILERYGMTETGFVLSNPYAGERRAGTVGRPVAGYEARVVDEAGAPVAVGAPGELEVRGDGLMEGYWRQPETTAASFRDGWFRTGDVVTVDADGVYRIVGRSSVDIIKSGGFKISAREIEEVLAEDPRVAEVAVVGTPDPMWGELITAAVVLAPSAPPVSEADLLAELQALAAARLADYKKPRAVRVLPALPRNALGKVQKHRLRDG
ncbi:MAG: hypothetical protein EP329_07085, partial [Deltaproteobacteria bacterium]